MHRKPPARRWHAAAPALLLAPVIALASPAAASARDATTSPGASRALGNGLASTPPMGWNDWNAYGCNVNEQLVRRTALAMHDNGMQAAGYQYVNIDDCWMTRNRDANGNLVADPVKFPSGIAAVADYVHSLGLKFGIYEDAGTATCAGFPGSYGHEQQDAGLFASWGVDYVKYDWCNVPFSGFPGQSHQQVARTLYTRMRDALAATGRPIVFSMCNGWDGSVQPWTWAAPVANLWRTTVDIQPSYSSMLSNFRTNVGLARYAGPGAWNDPDMLEIGNGMSAVEDRTEFSLWAEMAAPLIEGSDVADPSPATLSVLTNKAVIAVDQDPLGEQGTQVSSSGGLHVLAKPLANGDVSVVLFNETGSTATISTTAAAVGKSGASSYTLTDLWTGGTSTTTGTISASVPAHGTVMYRMAGGTTTPSGAVRAVGAGKCLDVPNSTQDNGAQVQIWDCNGGSNQSWTRTSSRQLTAYGGTKCLDAYDNQTSPGTKVEIWDCNGGANQQWQVNANGTITGVQSGLCLDVTGAGTGNGTPVELWTCNGGSNQQWAFD
ncbi:glycoside hydrolase family 27 protein [Actinomadura bangladeshensis]|uniref:Alpha-galactosidase n=1 Tax=Actinomadura bangladeshensis TaxID=453573 RepID=A0A4R4P751_9ACTN|nr:RICIN domain-containing protein [Actinomadura bangladeshensis]TDC17809.1 alpha-galactosidase [Actinomadura bangladeshensis]